MLVTACVAGFLGFWAYRYSRGQTEALSIQMSMQPGLSGDAMDEITDYAEAEDRKVLLAICGGIVFLMVMLGATGIVVTHRVVGPSYKLKRLISHVADGHLEVAGRLRKGDELQDVFLAFERMVLDLRSRQQMEVDKLDDVLEVFEREGVGAVPLATLREVRDQMAAELERKTLS